MVDYIAILVATVVSYVLGALWYSPMLFGNVWAKLSGMDKKMGHVSKKSMNIAYAGTFVTTLITAFVLSRVIALTGMNTLTEGIVIGLLVWVGFFATTQFGKVLWEQMPLKVYLINSGHYLVSLLIMGAILTLF